MDALGEVPKWRKSKRSSSGNCVEVQPHPQVILVRDSKNPAGAILTFDRAAFADFLTGVRNGEFDLH
jgi:hypothetical protein